ncbi:MAG: hemerythrin domain-containing protein [Sandaracinaceae bacterium]|nr:hemerythrin domain-containing protein [Sandaracinaceae bacterium]
MSTQHLQRQHAELTALAAEIVRLLRPEVVEADPRTIRILVARFAGKLRVHDRMESRGLYPALLVDEREEVRAAATRLKQELGGLYAFFDGYERRYPDASSLARDPKRFIADTLEMLAVLGKRMQRENRELYALLG